jgi:hypothetical protein
MIKKFGWSLPPGVSARMIDEAYGIEGPCVTCGAGNPDDCICPECPVCGVIGDPGCYIKHGLKLSDAQMDGQKRLKGNRDE